MKVTSLYELFRTLEAALVVLRSHGFLNAIHEYLIRMYHSAQYLWLISGAQIQEFELVFQSYYRVHN